MTWKATVGDRQGKGAGDFGGVWERGTDGDGGVEEPGRPVAVFARVQSTPTEGLRQGRRTSRRKSDPLIVLGLRESRTQGEAAGQYHSCTGIHSLYTEAGYGCQHN